jgi:exosortase
MASTRQRAKLIIPSKLENITQEKDCRYCGGLFRGHLRMSPGTEQARENRIMPSSLNVGVLISTVMLFWQPLKAVARLSLHDDRYIEVLVAPILCALLIFWDRTRIFSNARYSPRLGIPLLLLGVLLCLTLVHGPSAHDEYARLELVIFAIVFTWVAAFVLCFGTRSFKIAVIPLCCLFLMTPAPPAWMDHVTVGLQQASAATSYAILRLVGIPVFRQGMTFLLRGITVEVAPECSGIRSCLVFVLVAILASRVCLRSVWTQWTLIAFMIPIAIFKNAVRIVVISSLSAYVDPGYLHGQLHHEGGVVFSLVGIALFVALLYALQWLEKRGGEKTLLRGAVAGLPRTSNVSGPASVR